MRFLLAGEHRSEVDNLENLTFEAAVGSFRFRYIIQQQVRESFFNNAQQDFLGKAERAFFKLMPKWAKALNVSSALIGECLSTAKEAAKERKRLIELFALFKVMGVFSLGLTMLLTFLKHRERPNAEPQQSLVPRQ